MPNFTAETDIEVDEFLSECSDSEIKEAIDFLIEEGHLNDATVIENNTTSNHEGDFISKLRDLSLKYYSMSNEDIVQIEELHKRYC
jgi:hypothetical protein